MKLSIVIPYYNEVGTIRASVDRVRAAPVAEMEIIRVKSVRATAPASCCAPKLPPW